MEKYYGVISSGRIYVRNEIPSFMICIENINRQKSVNIENQHSFCQHFGMIKLDLIGEYYLLTRLIDIFNLDSNIQTVWEQLVNKPVVVYYNTNQWNDIICGIQSIENDDVLDKSTILFLTEFEYLWDIRHRLNNDILKLVSVDNK